jgi:hypothetical protein
MGVSADHISQGPCKYCLFLRLAPLLGTFFVSVSFVKILCGLERWEEVHISLSPVQGAEPKNVKLQHVDSILKGVHQIVLIVVVECYRHQATLRYESSSFVGHN